MKKRLRYLGKRLVGGIRNLPKTIPTLPRRLADWAVSLVRPTPQQKKKRRLRWKRLWRVALALILTKKDPTP